MTRVSPCGKRSDAMRDLKISLSFKWYEFLLILVEAGLVAMGVWALVDSLIIASPVAAWKFFLLFIIWALPGGAILVFFRPRSGV